MTRSILAVRRNFSARGASICLGAALAIGCGAPADEPGQAGGAIGPAESDTVSSRAVTPPTLPVADDLVAPGVPTNPRSPPVASVQTELVAGVALRQGMSISWVTWLTSQRPDDQRCGRRELGPCVIYDCRGTTLDSGGPRVTGLDGGKVAITGGMTDAIVMNPDADGRYVPVRRVNRDMWVTGDTVSFNSTSAVSGASLASALQVPEALPVFAAAYDDGPLWTAKRTDALPLQWQAVEGEVAVEIDETDGSETPGLDDRTMLCVFPGAQGSGSVPVEAMTSLLPTDHVAQPITTLRIGRRTHKVVPVGRGWASISLINATEVKLYVW